jgi:hypothetical protein
LRWITLEPVLERRQPLPRRTVALVEQRTRAANFGQQIRH